MSDTTGGGGAGGGNGGRRRSGGLFDDLAGVASGAFSALAGVRAEVEAAARSQAEALVQRLDLVKREELDAALEVARRAREGQEALEARVAALEAKLAAAAQPPVAPSPEPALPPETRTEAAPDGL
ncbi:MAG: accessory factor UbiK family protein [Acetobacteraceae bacterium]|nr:accessory factor UbiK family protein [Acetobacteraceae bacterium]